MSGRDFRNSILDHVDDFERDAQLVGKLLDNRIEQSAGRPDYFYLTDLVNPQTAFWDHVGASPEHTERQEELFAHGKRMESYARKAFANIDEFVEAEATIDGAENDIPGVRGKIDFRFRDSIVEFKTSEYMVESPDDIWSLAPQDIEQLLFYSVIWAHDNPTHYLIYMLSEEPKSTRAFEITIEDPGELKTRLRSRKSNIQYAIDTDNPIMLGRCRYYDHTCHIQQDDICSCDELDPLETEPLEEAVTVQRDHQLEEEIVEAFQELRERVGAVGAWDLYAPRQWYARQFEGQERDGDYVSPEWVHGALETAGLTPGPFTELESPKIDGQLLCTPKARFVERTRSTNRGPETQWVPARIVAKDYDSPPDSYRLKNQFMKVGCACAATGHRTGLLIIELPNSETEVDVHEITFNDPDGIRQKIIERLSEMNEAVYQEDPEMVPECPDFIQEYDCRNCLCE